MRNLNFFPKMNIFHAWWIKFHRSNFFASFKKFLKFRVMEPVGTSKCKNEIISIILIDNISDTDKHIFCKNNYDSYFSLHL